jgi:glycosyltransferase involved in cell wall biosynthesis
VSLATGQGLVVVNTSTSWGGNEHWAVQVAAGMARRGARVLFVWGHETVGERVRAAGLDHRRIPLRTDGDLPALLRLRDAIVSVRARAVVPTRWREYLLAGLAARLAGRPRVVMRLGLNIRPRDDVKRRLVFRLADRVIVNAPEIRTTLASVPWLDHGRVAVVLNGLDLTEWPTRWQPEAVAAGRALRVELGIDAECPLLLAVGSFSAQKDFLGLLDAVARVRHARPQVRLLLIGDGGQRQQLLDRREELDLADVVLMPGFLPDVRAAMAAADLFVLSSRNEGMARVLIEAAASGLPAVATGVSGTHLAVDHGRTGLVVPSEQPTALGDAIVELLDAPERRTRLGQAARRLAEQRFDARRMLDETEAILFG